MMHDERFRRKSAAGAATALSLLMLAVGGSLCSPAIAQEQPSDNPYATPETTEPRRRGKADDAYSPPPDKRSYLPTMGPPAADQNPPRTCRREAHGRHG